MDSLHWVDQTYVQKHQSEDPHNLRAMYHQNLDQYPKHAPKIEQTDDEKSKWKQAVVMYATKQGRKAAISLAVLALSYLPYVGRFVLPAASFYTFRKSVGTQPAAIIFAGSLFFPRRYMVAFLQAYFSSRTLMRELVCLPTLPYNYVADIRAAGAVFCPRPLQPSSEEDMVQGPRRRSLRFWSWLLHLREDPTSRRPDLRPRGSIHSLLNY